MEDTEALGIGGKLDFLEHFAALPDPCQTLKVLYPLDEVLLLTLCAVLCGAGLGERVPFRQGQARFPAPLPAL